MRDCCCVFEMATFEMFHVTPRRRWSCAMHCVAQTLPPALAGVLCSGSLERWVLFFGDVAASGIFFGIKGEEEGEREGGRKGGRSTTDTHVHVDTPYILYVGRGEVFDWSKRRQGLKLSQCDDRKYCRTRSGLGGLIWRLPEAASL